jgi:hypothetical protein
MTHREIAGYLSEKHQCPPWWTQMVTVGYKQERGLREKHQEPDGYSPSASKTVAVSVARLYEAWMNKKRRAAWLPDAELRSRKATAPKSLHIS